MSELQNEKKKNEKDPHAEIVKHLKANVNQERKPVKSSKNTSRNKIDTNKMIENANKKVLLDVLSPQIEKNEEKKRIHKDSLMKTIKIFLAIQFFILFLVVGVTLGAIIFCHIQKNPFDKEVVQMMFTFVGVYITSVIVELITILRYVVTKVFDTSIAELVKIFKEGDENNK